MRFYFPTKPTRISIDSTVFSQCEKDPFYVAQRKKDGWRIQIHKSGSNILIYTRHNKLLFPLISDVNWNTMRSQIAESIECDSCILDGEFMHRRSTQKETFYLWDIFELSSKPLKLPYQSRYAELTRIITNSSTIQILDNYHSNFHELWSSLDRTVDEGLVIKDIRESLSINFSKTTKSPRQYKILLDDPRNQYGDLDLDRDR